MQHTFFFILEGEAAGFVITVFKGVHKGVWGWG